MLSCDTLSRLPEYTPNVLKNLVLDFGDQFNQILRIKSRFEMLKYRCDRFGIEDYINQVANGSTILRGSDCVKAYRGLEALFSMAGSEVRFFDAVTRILGFQGVYGGFAADKIGVVPNSVKELFEEISLKLLEHNMKNALIAADSTKDGVILSFDMIISEQQLLQRLLDEKDLSTEQKLEINAAVNIPKKFHPVLRTCLDVVGDNQIDYFNMEHRIVIGNLYCVYTGCGRESFEKIIVSDGNIIFSHKNRGTFPLSLDEFCGRNLA